jgi:hypothetical protein
MCELELINPAFSGTALWELTHTTGIKRLASSLKLTVTYHQPTTTTPSHPLTTQARLHKKSIAISRYTASHANPQGPRDTRPTALQVVKDEGLIGKLTGKVALITGANSSIGVETARALHAAGPLSTSLPETPSRPSRPSTKSRTDPVLNLIHPSTA